ncbi:MAG: glutaredoxin family protein [Ruminococcus sp.]|jgi:glutaredoxin|nr:glutaredoxin family protein [Ruminococcus sp.]
MIKVYSSHTCPYCEKLKRYFDSIDISYDTIYIDDSRESLEELVALTGIAGVPVTVFGGGEYVLGYDREKIDSLLKSQKTTPKEKKKSVKVRPIRIEA